MRTSEEDRHESDRGIEPESAEDSHHFVLGTGMELEGEGFLAKSHDTPSKRRAARCRRRLNPLTSQGAQDSAELEREDSGVESIYPKNRSAKTAKIDPRFVATIDSATERIETREMLPLQSINYARIKVY